ncbi:ImmA/IrrE family metallo-endopeptidase [Longispora urticae]
MNGQRTSAQLRGVTQGFSGRRLTLARQLAGLRKNGLAERIGRTGTAVASYENGSKKPSSSTVAQLALVLGVEPEFFLPTGVENTDRDPLRAAPHFRSLRSTTQVDRDRAGAYGALVHDIAAVLERHVELPERDVPPYPVSPDHASFGEPEEAARRLRKAWEMPPGPAGHLVRLAEHHGILVVFAIAQSASVDAYSIDTAYRPMILLNPLKNDYFRQRFDVAHEIGHLVMHSDAEPGGRTVEDQAHRFAAEFLMPADEIAGHLPQRADWQKLLTLKARWKVSLQALLMRARQLSIMNENTYTNAMAALSSKGWRRQEPGAMQVQEHPSLLPRSIELMSEAGYDIERLAREYKIPLQAFRAATSRVPSLDIQEILPVTGGDLADVDTDEATLVDLAAFRR